MGWECNTVRAPDLIWHCRQSAGCLEIFPVSQDPFPDPAMPRACLKDPTAHLIDKLISYRRHLPPKNFWSFWTTN